MFTVEFNMECHEKFTECLDNAYTFASNEISCRLVHIQLQMTAISTISYTVGSNLMCPMSDIFNP